MKFVLISTLVLLSRGIKIFDHFDDTFHPTAEQVISLADSNKDGEVSVDQMAAFGQTQDSSSTLEQKKQMLEVAYKLFDKDKNGKLNKDQLKEMISFGQNKVNDDAPPTA